MIAIILGVIVTVLGVGFTGYQAMVAAESLEQSQDQIAKQAAFESTRESYLAFVDGHAAFSSELWEIRNRLPFDVEEPADVERATAAEIEVLREAVGSIVPARHAYTATVRAAMPLWPQEIRADMIKVEQHGLRLAACFEAAALRALNEEEVRQVKGNLNIACRALGREKKHLDEDTNAVFALMSNRLYDVLEDLGAAPDRPPV